MQVWIVFINRNRKRREYLGKQRLEVGNCWVQLDTSRFDNTWIDDDTGQVIWALIEGLEGQTLSVRYGKMLISSICGWWRCLWHGPQRSKLFGDEVTQQTIFGVVSHLKENIERICFQFCSKMSYEMSELGGSYDGLDDWSWLAAPRLVEVYFTYTPTCVIHWCAIFLKLLFHALKYWSHCL